MSTSWLAAQLMPGMTLSGCLPAALHMLSQVGGKPAGVAIGRLNTGLQEAGKARQMPMQAGALLGGQRVCAEVSHLSCRPGQWT